MDYKKEYLAARKRAKEIFTYYCDDREQLGKILYIFPDVEKEEEEDEESYPSFDDSQGTPIIKT
jgi:hypothetical protein